MKDYESMSDFQVNKQVAIHKSLKTEHKTGVSKYKCSPCGYMIVRKDDLIYYPFDPVTNISQAWPIIIKNKIAFYPRKASDEWFAFSTCENEFEYVDKNPLRAAMIVYLMMNEE